MVKLASAEPVSCALWREEGRGGVRPPPVALRLQQLKDTSQPWLVNWNPAFWFNSLFCSTNSDLWHPDFKPRTKIRYLNHFIRFEPIWCLLSALWGFLVVPRQRKMNKTQPYLSEQCLRQQRRRSHIDKEGNSMIKWLYDSLSSYKQKNNKFDF